MKAEKQAGIVILFLFVLLVVFVAVMLFTNKSGYKYNGFEVQEVKQGNYIGYRTVVYINNGKDPSFINSRYGPREVENFETDIFREDIINKKNIYITIDPKQNLTGITTIALFEVNNLIEIFYSIRVDGALTDNSGNYTKKTCVDVTEEEGIVWLRKGDKNKIINQDGCIIIEGITEEDLIKGADRLIFGLLEIIK